MQFYVYILSNVHRGVLYTGVTNDLVRRVFEHREKSVDGFAERYGTARLVYFNAIRLLKPRSPAKKLSSVGGVIGSSN